MMLSIKDGDLEVVDGMVVMVEGEEMLRQHCEIRLGIYRGEVFYNLLEGVDYIDLVFPAEDPVEVLGEFRRVAMGTPGVEAVEMGIVDNTPEKMTIAGQFIGDTGVQAELVLAEFKVEIQKGP